MNVDSGSKRLERTFSEVPDSGPPTDGEAHVWTVPVDLQTPPDAVLLDRLHRTERERAARHASPDARARYATVRVALRGILARYVGCAADALELHTAEGGKPVLLNTDEVHFSVSHARDSALIAVCRAPVGVDLEHVRPPHRLERTATRLLHADTVAMLARLPAPRRLFTFFEAWTQREAHVKAVGGGLFRTPDTLPFRSGLDPDTPCTVHDRDSAEEWTVARLSCAPDMRAALVTRSALRRIINLHWKEDLDE